MATRMDTPYAVHRVARTKSTQDDARSLFESSPVVVVADEQSEGRGRSGRRWENAPRAVAASVAWRPVWPADTWPRLSLVAGLAARAAVDEVTSRQVGLKWPNDLLTEHGKVGGLLLEVFGDVAVAGLGVNLWWPKPPESYAGLLKSDPGSGIVQHVAEAWAQKLLGSMERSAQEWGRAEFEAHCLTIGQQVRWQPHRSGKATGVATDGALIVETTAGVEHLSISEVWELRTQ